MPNKAFYLFLSFHTSFHALQTSTSSVLAAILATFLEFQVTMEILFSVCVPRYITLWWMKQKMWQTNQKNKKKTNTHNNLHVLTQHLLVSQFLSRCSVLQLTCTHVITRVAHINEKYLKFTQLILWHCHKFRFGLQRNHTDCI